jgi:YidC/Oxa1 family membrane protein insertase
LFQSLINLCIRFFEFIHVAVTSVIPNQNIAFGATIILVTLIIRILLLPLNIKQTKSSIQMSAVQPLTKKIQEKYKSDPKKSQEEVMKLYKEKGVSPFGGCLPLIVQYPILIALYYVFNNLQGISGVHFLWINDLASRDIILALFSGITTYFSGNLMTSTAGGDVAQNKTNRMMNIGMSVFMTFICWSLKSALVLYWTINNLVQIIQTIIIKRYEENKNNKA